MLIKTFETDQEYQEERDLILKGLRFDDFDNELRSLIKHDGYKEWLLDLELEHKVRKEALEDIVLQVLTKARKQLNDSI